MRILIVDDDPQMRGMLLEYLGNSHDVSILSDGRNAEAVLMAPDHDFDIVLLDIMIPRINGADILKHLEASKSKVKVVLTSGQSELQSFIGHPNVVSTLEKPFHLEDFARKLETYR